MRDGKSMSSSCDVLFVGNAIMDVLAPCEDGFLTDNHIEKGGMNLIDEDRALQLYLSLIHISEPTRPY